MYCLRMPEGVHLLPPQKVFEEQRKRFAAVLAYRRNFNLLPRGLSGMRRIVLHRIAACIEGVTVVGEQLRMIEGRGLDYGALIGQSGTQEVHQIGLVLQSEPEYVD